MLIINYTDLLLHKLTLLDQYNCTDCMCCVYMCIGNELYDIDIGYILVPTYIIMLYALKGIY